MRFLLDEDVDARVTATLTAAGHDAWTVPDAGLSAATDEEVAAYAHMSRNAVVVSHDKEFSRWRRVRLIGRHLHLKCDEPDAADLLDESLAEIIPVFARRENAHCILGQTGFEFTFPQWA